MRRNKKTTPIGETVSTPQEATSISNLKVNQSGVNLLVTVVKKGSEKTIKKYGKELLLGVFLVKDKSGEIRLTLWNNIINMVGDNDTLYIENAFVREWNNNRQITPGRNGKIQKMN